MKYNSQNAPTGEKEQTIVHTKAVLSSVFGFTSQKSVQCTMSGKH